MLIKPPPINKQFEYPELEQVTRPDGIRHYVSPEGDHLPSVTTILGQTGDKTYLNEWIARVGQQKADFIRDQAAAIGSVMHTHMEDWLVGEDRPSKKNLPGKVGRLLANNLINKALGGVDEVWAIEERLYYPGLYAGTADLIGVYKGKPAIMDFKNSRRIKKRDQIGDYFCQLASYALAHNKLFGTDIQHGVIFMCVRDIEDEPMMTDFKSHDRDVIVFEVEGVDFQNSQGEFIDRVETYFAKNATA